MNEEEPQVNTDAQRRALDVMSAQLLDNLNTMIAEQEARVQEFSRQQSSLSPLPMEEMTPVLPPTPQTISTHSVTPKADITPDAKAWEQIPVTPVVPEKPARRSVTPPPLHAQKKKAPEQPYRIPRPSLNRPIPTGKDNEKENSVGCGKMAVLIVIILIVLRACC